MTQNNQNTQVMQLKKFKEDTVDAVLAQVDQYQELGALVLPADYSAANALKAFNMLRPINCPIVIFSPLINQRANVPSKAEISSAIPAWCCVIFSINVSSNKKLLKRLE